LKKGKNKKNNYRNLSFKKNLPNKWQKKRDDKKKKKRKLDSKMKKLKSNGQQELSMNKKKLERKKVVLR
jgi:hypothetical protein